MFRFSFYYVFYDTAYKLRFQNNSTIFNGFKAKIKTTKYAKKNKFDLNYLIETIYN